MPARGLHRLFWSRMLVIEEAFGHQKEGNAWSSTCEDSDKNGDLIDVGMSKKNIDMFLDMFGMKDAKSIAKTRGR